MSDRKKERKKVFSNRKLFHQDKQSSADQLNCQLLHRIKHSLQFLVRRMITQTNRRTRMITHRNRIASMIAQKNRKTRMISQTIGITRRRKTFFSEKQKMERVTCRKNRISSFKVTVFDNYKN